MFEHYQMTEKDHTAKILKITHNTTVLLLLLLASILTGLFLPGQSGSTINLSK